MNTLEIRALYDEERRRLVEDPAMRCEVAGPVVRLISRHDRQSCVIYSRLDQATVESAISKPFGAKTPLDITNVSSESCRINQTVLESTSRMRMADPCPPEG